MAFSFTFGGVRSEYKDISVNAIRRSIVQPISPRTIDVPDRIGQYFFKNDIIQRTLEVDITINENSLTTFREQVEKIAKYLDPTIGVQSLVFDDFTDRTWYAVLSDKTDLNQILSIGQGTLIFLVPDGVAYSSSSVTFDATPPTGSLAGSLAFSRASVAYAEDGTQFSASAPRYEPCAYGHGIRIEEGTTNLLTADESSFETSTGNIVGITSGDITNRDYTFSQQGIVCMKVVTTGIATGEGAELFTPGYITISASTTYTFSVYIRGDGAPLQIALYYYTGASAFISSSLSTTFNTSTGGFVRVSFSDTSPVGAAQLQYKILTPSIISTTFYIDCLQLEAKHYATGWQVGGTARSDELLKLNPINYINMQRGTIDFYFKPTGHAGDFGGMFELGRFSAASTRDRFTLIRGTCSGGGAKQILFIIVSSAHTHGTTLKLNMPTTWVTDNIYYCAIRWYLDGNLTNSFMKINIADLANNVEHSTVLHTTQAFPLFNDATVLSTAFIGSLRNGAYWSNCIYDDLRFSGVPRNDTQITDTWKSRRSLLKDQQALTKYNFDKTLAATVLSNIGTAPVDPTITITFIDNTTTPSLTQYKPGATSETYVFETSGKVTAGNQLTIDSANRSVTSTTAGNINFRVQLLSDFPRITGDHYYSATPLGTVPSHNPKIRVTYTPRWL